jgi:hypothetical protein
MDTGGQRVRGLQERVICTAKNCDIAVDGGDVAASVFDIYHLMST